MSKNLPSLFSYMASPLDQYAAMVRMATNYRAPITISTNELESLVDEYFCIDEYRTFDYKTKQSVGEQFTFGDSTKTLINGNGDVLHGVPNFWAGGKQDFEGIEPAFTDELKGSGLKKRTIEIIGQLVEYKFYVIDDNELEFIALIDYALNILSGQHGEYELLSRCGFLHVDAINQESTRRECIKLANKAIEFIDSLYTNGATDKRLFFPDVSEIVADESINVVLRAMSNFNLNNARARYRAIVPRWEKVFELNYSRPRKEFRAVFDIAWAKKSTVRKVFTDYIHTLEDEYYIGVIRNKEALKMSRESTVETLQQSSEIQRETARESARITADLARVQAEIQEAGMQRQKRAVDELAHSMAAFNRGQ